ncbi:Mannose-P-dolichol utilization defect 1 protein [Smittium culicis]|uniref:Mannose-P-dolichol utilization defect 1 protein homolog n=1 Tax=Smittium culicis TaxID=133412 RepID=A0A1R1YK97_9FUNG|nr:Mannose-P-dolichol utilization defect 1 protein [Smittium culicis]OMJ29195.1 Mannose-P-dolichol utilization defect 1 protein [Smittium culicis]
MVYLPSFLRDPIALILGEKCTETLIDRFDILEPTCLRFAISKALGIAIVAGGCIVKLPQIYKIISSKSARGLSLASFLLETMANFVNIAYSIRQNFPFTTFGESVFIGIQNYFIAITIMILNGQELLGMVAAGMLVVVAYLLNDSSWTSGNLLATLQALTIPLLISSRIPQILKIHKEKTTGQLSSFSVFNYFLGTLARIYTTFVEVDNNLVLAGYLLSLVTNGILAAQMIYYWNSSPKSAKLKNS